MNFEFLSTSIGTPIQLERGGPDKVVGELVDVRSDHIVLRNDQHGVLYCASEHVKTITHPILPVLESEDSEESGEWEQAIPVVEADDIVDLLSKLRHAFIQVNTGGPNALKGVLMEVRPDSVTLMNEMKEFVHYSIHHIRSISRIYNVMVDDKQNQNNKNEDNKESFSHTRESSDKESRRESSKEDRRESRREDRKEESGRRHADRERRHSSRKEE